MLPSLSLPLRGALRLLVAFAAVLAGFAVNASTASAAGCDRVAALNGSDGAAGSADAPFRSAQKLVDALSPGQTGCLRGGVFAEQLRFSRGGVAGAPVTLQSYPGERATLLGRLYVPDAANHVAVQNLDLDGSAAPKCDADSTCTILPSPVVAGDDVTFRGNDVTNRHTAICFSLGPGSWGRAERTTIEGNRIHDCGRLPRTNHDHGIYVEHATDTAIVGNTIYGNSDRGVQLYPDAQRTVVRGNIIYGNGQGILFAGDEGLASHDTRVTHNVVVNSTVRYNVESWYPDGNPIGRNNLVEKNCIAGGARDHDNHGSAPEVGFTTRNNLAVVPRFADARNADFRIADGDPCKAVLAGADVPSATPAQPSAAAQSPSPSTQSPSAPTQAPAAPVTRPGGGDRPAAPSKRRTKKRLRVTLKTRVARKRRSPRARVGISGRVLNDGLRAASANGARRPTRVLVKVRTKAGWRTLGKAKLRGSRQSFRLVGKLRLKRSQSKIRMRVTLPGRGTSAVVQRRV